MNPASGSDESKASREIFRFEDFELDRGVYELRRAGRPVRLQRLPLELLYFLVERRGELVTREEIIERLWGKSVFVDSENSINTAVRKIRQALNDDSDAPRFIITVPARGYRFVASIHETNGAIDEGSSILAVSSAASREAGRRQWPRGAVIIVGLALSAALVVLTLHFSPRPPTASIPPAQSPALPLPDKPSIAVLPLTNMSGDREQEYFSDGITDDLITALSRLPSLFVIAHTSSFTYKGKAVRLQDVGKELGVKYVLGGGVRKAGDQVRITVQLADATTGEELWAERYDRPLRDIFALQDEIVRRIVTTLNLQLDLMQRGADVRQTTDNLEAYDDFLRGLEFFWNTTRDGNAKAREMFEKAIELDAKYARAYAFLGYSYWRDWTWQWSHDPHTLDRAFQLEQQAIALDDSLPVAHMGLGEVYLFRKQYDHATAEAERAIALDLNSAVGYKALAEIMGMSGKPAEAIGLAEKAMRLDPRNRDFYLFFEGESYTQMGRYEQAIPILKRHLASYPNSWGAHGMLVVDYTELGREDEARAEAAEVLRISPHFSLDRWMQISPQEDQAFLKRLIADLRKAGLK